MNRMDIQDIKKRQIIKEDDFNAGILGYSRT